MTNPTYTQAAYRFYEDGTEAGSVAIDAQDTAITRTVVSDSTLLLRIRFQNGNATAGLATDDYQLQRGILRSGGVSPAGFVSVTTTSNGVKAFDSSNLTNGGATTNRLGAGSGSFVAGEVSEDGLVDDLQITASNFTEFLFTITLVAAELAHGDVVTFRVLRNGATTGLTFTVTPTITISKVSTGFGALKGTLKAGAVSIPNPASPVGSVSVALKDLIYVLISEQASLTATTVADNLGNSYTDVNAGSDAGNSTGRAYFSVVTNAGTLTQVDITTTASTDNYAAVALAFEGPFAASPLDANPANGVTDVTSPIDLPPTGTLTQADELVIGGLCENTWNIAQNGNVSTLSVTPPQQLLVTQGDSQGVTAWAAVIGWVVSATTTVTPSLTTSVDPTVSVLITASFKKEVAGAHQGNATFGGAGNLSNAARQNNQAASTLPGTSTLSAATTQTHQAAARFAGAGSLSARVEKFIFATFAGSGSLSSLATLGEQAAATFAGAGSLSANSQVSKTVEATFQGNGDVSVLAWLNARIAATFNGAGNLSVDATQISAGGQAHVGEATFNGAGALSALATLNEAAAATFAGTGLLSAQADKSKTGEATFSGAGALSARVTGRLVAFATFGGAGSLSVNTISAQRAAATFNGSGSLSAFSQAENVKDGQAIFAGAGSLSANVTRQNLQAAATFAGAGSLSATVRLGQAALAQLAGAGSLSASLRQNNRAFATFNGEGALSARAAIRTQIAARFAGAGDFSVLLTQGHVVTATMEGIGSLQADAAAFVFGTKIGEATFVGQGGMVVDLLQFGPRRSRTSIATATLNVRSNNATDGRRNTANDVRGAPPKVRRTG